MPTRDFSTSAPAEGQDADPVVFRVVGTDLNRRPIEPIPFFCLPAINGVVLTDAIEKADKGEMAMAGHITRFIRQCLPDSEEKRFVETIYRKDLIIEIETLGKITEWLFEVY